MPFLLTFCEGAIIAVKEEGKVGIADSHTVSIFNSSIRLRKNTALDANLCTVLYFTGSGNVLQRLQNEGELQINFTGVVCNLPHAYVFM